MGRSQKQAKQFFAGRVIRQAESEGIPLSDAERHMLLWSESDASFEPDPQLADALSSQMSDDEYESKISGLLRRAFRAEAAADPHTRKRWNDAFKVLERGDHYISIMIGQAVGRKLRPWWSSRWLRAIPPVLMLLAIFSGLAFAVDAIAGPNARRDEEAAALWMIYMAVVVLYGIARLTCGEAVDNFIYRIIDFFDRDV